MAPPRPGRFGVVDVEVVFDPPPHAVDAIVAARIAAPVAAASGIGSSARNFSGAKYVNTRRMCPVKS